MFREALAMDGVWIVVTPAMLERGMQAGGTFLE